MVVKAKMMWQKVGATARRCDGGFRQIKFRLRQHDIRWKAWRSLKILLAVQFFEKRRERDFNFDVNSCGYGIYI